MWVELRTEKRGYSLSVDRDLLGDYVLQRRWFGLSNKRGGRKTSIFSSEEAAIKVAQRIARRRAIHGYVPVARSSDGLF